MSAIKQHFQALNNRLEIDMGRTNKKLLFAAVILFALLGSLINPVKGMEQFIFLLSQDESVIVEQIGNEPKNQDGFLIDQSYLKANLTSNLTANSLVVLTIQPDSLPNEQSQSFQESSLAFFQENALLAQTNPTTFISQEPRTEIISYVVQQGDTASSIAAHFGITTNTLLWANKLSATSIIRPGDELSILPVTGLIHRVSSSETIGWIAKYYDAQQEDIIAFNDLPADGAIQIGQKLIIPDGQMPAPVQTKSTRTASKTYSGAGTGQSRVFPYGQCTWYVAQKRIVPWSGHAKYWLGNAQAMGYSVCYGTTCQAQVGAIVGLKDGGWMARVYGHVAYVIKVEANRFLISEMNRLGWAIESVRWIPNNSYLIKGFIY